MEASFPGHSLRSSQRLTDWKPTLSSMTVVAISVLTFVQAQLFSALFSLKLQLLSPFGPAPTGVVVVVVRVVRG